MILGKDDGQRAARKGGFFIFILYRFNVGRVLSFQRGLVESRGGHANGLGHYPYQMVGRVRLPSCPQNKQVLN